MCSRCEGPSSLPAYHTFALVAILTTNSGVIPQGHKQQGRALVHQTLPRICRVWKPAVGTQELSTAHIDLKFTSPFLVALFQPKVNYKYIIKVMILQMSFFSLFFRGLIFHSTVIYLSVFQWSFVKTVTSIYLISLPLFSWEGLWLNWGFLQIQLKEMWWIWFCKSPESE